LSRKVPANRHTLCSLLICAQPLRPSPELEVLKELICETVWIREREEVAAGQLLDLDLQSLLRDPTLELDRKEPIVASRDHVDGNLGPGFESARLSEHDVGLGALVRLALLDELGRHVVQEVRGEVEVAAVATLVCGRCPRRDRLGCCPTTLQPSRREPGSSR
jgi:hypothetical protein